MISFNDWLLLAEGKKGKKAKKGKTPQAITPPKQDDNVLKIKVDPTKIARGHQPHMSGAGIHGEKDAPRKKNWKDQLD